MNLAKCFLVDCHFHYITKLTQHQFNFLQLFSQMCHQLMLNLFWDDCYIGQLMDQKKENFLNKKKFMASMMGVLFVGFVPNLG